MWKVIFFLVASKPTFKPVLEGWFEKSVIRKKKSEYIFFFIFPLFLQKFKHLSIDMILTSLIEMSIQVKRKCYHSFRSELLFFFLPCSLFPPFSSSFTHLSWAQTSQRVSLSCTAGPSLTWSLACRAYFFRLLDVVNKPFTQLLRESLNPLDFCSRRHVIWKRDILNKYPAFCKKTLCQKLRGPSDLNSDHKIGKRKLSRSSNPAQSYYPPASEASKGVYWKWA